MYYTGETCPVCKLTFAEEDDIVVCPDCGTPHHRKCYLQNKRCAHVAAHATGFVWQPAEAPESEAAQAPNEQTAVCPHCGAKNPAEEPVCTSCGARLYHAAPQMPPMRPPFFPPVQPQTFRVGTDVLSPTDTIGGNSVNDTAEFVQANAGKYIAKFHKLDKTGKKLSWNWAAFLFAPYWFFYRKLYGVGAIFLALLLAASSISYTPRYVEASNAIFAVQEQYLDGTLTQEEYLAAFEASAPQLFKLPEVIAMGAAVIGLHLAAGLLANYFYKRLAEKEITRLRAVCKTPEEYHFSLFRRGGLSALMCLSSLFGYYAIQQFIALAISSFLS